MSREKLSTKLWVRQLVAEGKHPRHVARMLGFTEGRIYRCLDLTQAEQRARRVAEQAQLKVEREQAKAERRAAEERNRAQRAQRKTERWQRSHAGQRAKLAADGATALELLAQGLKPRHILLVIGGSRLRYYRALKAARVQAVAPPLSSSNPVPAAAESLDPLLL